MAAVPAVASDATARSTVASRRARVKVIRLKDCQACELQRCSESVRRVAAAAAGELFRSLCQRQRKLTNGKRSVNFEV